MKIISIFLFFFFIGEALAQEPTEQSNSTAEQAFEKFTEFWIKCSQDTAFWQRIHEEAQIASDLCRTESLKQKKALKRANTYKMQENTRVIWERFEIIKKAGEENNVLFTTYLHCKIRTPTFINEGVNEQAHKEPYALLFIKSGDNWLLKELWKPCSECNGSGSCPKCGGTGQYQGICSWCNGNRKCKRCDGKSMVRDTLTYATLINLGQLFITDDEFTPSSNMSEIRSAAKAYMDSWIYREIVTTKKVLEWLDQEMPKFYGMLTPENASAAKQVLDFEIEAGKKRYREMRHEIKVVKENEGFGFADTIAVVDGVEYRCGLLFQNIEGKWLVAAELSQQCVMCAGQGVCAACKGAGTIDNMECYACMGKGICTTCNGFGLVEGE